METTSTEFHLGLCLAGAVSAGAYTAGVMDYLVEALENWEQQKTTHKDSIPNHQVTIKVIGGASAGGMTGILTLAHLLKKHQPIQTLAHPLEEHPENLLFNSWVDMLQPNMMDVLLDTNDLKNKQAKSLLNATFVQQLAQRAISCTETLLNKPYLHESLQCFVSLTHLNGRNFVTPFKAEKSKNRQYITTRHDAFIGFTLNPSKTTTGWIPIDWNDPYCVQAMQEAAIATGAFPIGLEARTFSAQFIKKEPNSPTTFEKQTFVDGGVINNEPFEKVLELLHETTDFSEINSSKNTDCNQFDRTVVMIDPFPSETTDYTNNTAIGAVALDTFSALLNQCRSKPEDLADALDENNYGKFLISPVRYSGKLSFEGSQALACSVLGGFGGFLHRDFRVHDFFLGRANCERFLRHYFAVPKTTTNPIFVNGYANCNTDLFATKDCLLPIIPLFTPEKEVPYQPVLSNNQQFPQLKKSELAHYQGKIKTRIQAILLTLSNYSWTEKALLWIGSKIVINTKISSLLLEKIKKELNERNMLR